VEAAEAGGTALPVHAECIDLSGKRGALHIVAHLGRSTAASA